MKVSEEDARKAIERLGKGGNQFHTTQLARALTEIVGIEVKTDTAR